MPQKKNPDTMELVRGTAGDAAAGLNALLSILKGLPRAYNRDLQRAHPHAFEAVDAVREATTVAAGAVATAEWDAPALSAAASAGFSTATGVADLLAMSGIPFRTAHETVALAAEALEDGSDAAAAYAALEAAAAETLGEPLEARVDRAAVEAALDPAESVASRDSVGGPAPSAVEATRSRAREALDDHRGALESRREALDRAERRLDEEVARRV
jgi:argininosuccinate lyase